MEEIVVRYYNHSKDSIVEETTKAYSLKEAIEIMRQKHSFTIMCLGAHYKDEKALINSIKKMNTVKH